MCSSFRKKAPSFIPFPHLNYHSDPAKSEPAENSGAPPLADALAQQLGLRVEARKTRADIVVVDHVEKIPSSN